MRRDCLFLLYLRTRIINHYMSAVYHIIFQNWLPKSIQNTQGELNVSGVVILNMAPKAHVRCRLRWLTLRFLSWAGVSWSSCSSAIRLPFWAGFSDCPPLCVGGLSALGFFTHNVCYQTKNGLTTQHKVGQCWGLQRIAPQKLYNLPSEGVTTRIGESRVHAWVSFHFFGGHRGACDNFSFVRFCENV